MSVILILILASLGVALGFLGAFFWAVKSGQFDDTLTPSMRMLTGDEQNNPRNPGVGQTFLSAGSSDIPVARYHNTGLESPVNRQAGKPALRFKGSMRESLQKILSRNEEKSKPQP
jgi:cbb3-type cytochrome oxidase maturation protein